MGKLIIAFVVQPGFQYMDFRKIGFAHEMGREPTDLTFDDTIRNISARST